MCKRNFYVALDSMIVVMMEESVDIVTRFGPSKFTMNRQ